MLFALPLAHTVALVVDNQTALRAAPHDTAPRQAVLWEGDWLEVRGERQGFVQVYDHRRERPGYVRATQIRSYPLDETSAPALRSVIDFLRDGPGHESLGIGYVALYLRVAPANRIDADLFAALGSIAERLGRRASLGGQHGAATPAYLEVAESYGVHFHSFEKGGRTRLCYDGEADRRALALDAATQQKTPGDRIAQAALSLTDPTCVDPARLESERDALVRWQGGVIADALKTAHSTESRAALRIRRAEVLAQLAYAEARHGREPEAAAASDEAVKLVASVGAERPQLSDELDTAWQEASVRVAAVRWAAELPRRSSERSTKVTLEPGTPGQTCIVVHAPHTEELRHCTFGVVWPSSVRIAPSGNTVGVVVQTLPSWSELVLLQRSAQPMPHSMPTPIAETFEWTAQVLPPSAADPDIGYVELAGWSPDSAHLLVVRESTLANPADPDAPPAIRRRFQILNASSLAVEKEASTLTNFPSFRRWQSADWVGGTLALR